MLLPPVSLPTPAPLTAISASRYDATRNCLLREALASSGARPLLPGHPKAVLGTIAHRVMEEIGKGLLARDEPKIKQRWTQLCEVEEEKLRCRDLERHFVPLHQSCPEYFLIRARTVRAALEMSGLKAPADHATVGGWSGLGFEVFVRSRDGSVRGKIDVVEDRGGFPTIVDYKTGEIFEGDGQIKGEYINQLKIYAALYYESFKKWPGKLVLRPLKGTETEITFDTAECSALLKEVQEFLRVANLRIAESIQKADPSIIANAMPTNCFFCNFRPGCSAYWKARKNNPAMPWPVDLAGSLISKCLSLAGTWGLTLRLDDDEDRIVSVRRLQGDPRHRDLALVAEGSSVFAFNLRQEAALDSYAETPSTTIYSSPRVR